MTPRSFTIETRPARKHDTRGPHTELRCYGMGHWADCRGAPDRFRFEHSAIEAGEIWVRTGLQPCEQTAERIARIARDERISAEQGVPASPSLIRRFAVEPVPVSSKAEIANARKVA